MITELFCFSSSKRSAHSNEKKKTEELKTDHSALYSQFYKLHSNVMFVRKVRENDRFFEGEVEMLFEFLVT